MPRVTFLPERITAEVAEGTTLLQAARSLNMEIRTDCEFGWCGTDPFIVHEGGDNLSPPEEDERENLFLNHFPSNVRMACVAAVHGDVVVERYN